MQFSYLKYIVALGIPATTYIAMQSHGWMTWCTLLYAYLIIPLLELFFKSDQSNLEEDQEKKMLNNRGFDIMVYFMVFIQVFLLYKFLVIVNSVAFTTFEKVGVVGGMGICCGVLGINVAHELGHRRNKFEQFLSKILLLTSLYMHFFIEHNRGHHKHVSTKEDPSSARKGELVYTFWFRSIILAYLSAWKLEASRLNAERQTLFTLKNEMLLFQIVQVMLLAVICYFFGLNTMLLFVLAAIIGIIQLETVNYIEHYGLSRTKKNGRYERVQPSHSWNSNHIIGRLTLFELSRHSDHHYMASRKYQILRHHEDSPQMPTGYPGMMLLSLIPPLWFYVMHRRIKTVS